jgi:hypothetical protein
MHKGISLKGVLKFTLKQLQHLNIQLNQTTRCINLSDLFPVVKNTAQHFWGILMSIIRSLSTAVAASGLPLERGGSSVVGRGRAATFQR